MRDYLTIFGQTSFKDKDEIGSFISSHRHGCQWFIGLKNASIKTILEKFKCLSQSFQIILQTNGFL